MKNDVTKILDPSDGTVMAHRTGETGSRLANRLHTSEVAEELLGCYKAHVMYAILQLEIATLTRKVVIGLNVALVVYSPLTDKAKANALGISKVGDVTSWAVVALPSRAAILVLAGSRRHSRAPAEAGLFVSVVRWAIEDQAKRCETAIGLTTCRAILKEILTTAKG